MCEYGRIIQFFRACSYENATPTAGDQQAATDSMSIRNANRNGDSASTNLGCKLYAKFSRRLRSGFSRNCLYSFESAIIRGTFRYTGRDLVIL